MRSRTTWELVPAPKPWPDAIEKLVDCFMAAGREQAVGGQICVWLWSKSGEYVITVVVPEQQRKESLI